MGEATDIFTMEQCVDEMQRELVELRRNYIAWLHRPDDPMRPMIAVNIRSHVKSVAENIVIAADAVARLKEFGK